MKFSSFWLLAVQRFVESSAGADRAAISRAVGRESSQPPAAPMA